MTVIQNTGDAANRYANGMKGQARFHSTVLRVGYDTWHIVYDSLEKRPVFGNMTPCRLANRIRTHLRDVSRIVRMLRLTLYAANPLYSSGV